jgi:glyoxylase-like metal-dependent hydrolase (beta-lactamase superfamily II)
MPRHAGPEVRLYPLYGGKAVCDKIFLTARPGYRHTVREEDLAPSRLARIGLKPEEVDLVANCVRYEELDGDYDVSGDGSVVLIAVPGHSADTQAAILRLEETGTVVLASDAAYLTESIDHLLVSTWVFNLRQQVRSLKRLRDLRRCEGA